MSTHQLKQSLILGLLFFILTLPFTYEQSNLLLHNRITHSDRQGLPTLLGSLVHTLVFVVLAFGLLVWKTERVTPEEKIKIEKPETIII